jgi:hypothetical protein
MSLGGTSFVQRVGHFCKCLSGCVVLFFACQSTCWGQAAARQWSDSTGTFKITASLVEVKDNVAFLKTAEGKTLRIPVARLSAADQEFLKADASPFEVVEDDEMSATTTSNASSSTDVSSDGTPGMWSKPVEIDWTSVETLERGFDQAWDVSLPSDNALDFKVKNATLAKKLNFHEGLRRMEINPLAKRAVAGYTVSFTVPKPLSRLALIDLVSGKAIHSAPIETNMCPIGLLNDGSTVVMHGTGNERDGSETGDQIQLWRVTGKDVIRSPIWVPFPGTEKRFGRVSNPSVTTAISLPNNRLLLRSEHGHLACIDLVTRKPFWFIKLADNGEIDVNVDRTLIAAVDGASVIVIDPQAGKIVGSASMEGKPHVAWPRIRWSPSGQKILVTISTQLMLLDATTGKWLQNFSSVGAPLAPQQLDYPHEDYALLNGNLLLHIPSQIKVCSYRDAMIHVEGDTSIIAVQGGDAGLVVGSKIPHPPAEAVLKQAEDDPSVFLIHPGVEVSIDASGAGQWADQVKTDLEAAAANAGYRVSANAPLSLVATISGPQQKAVSYIASGSYIANEFTSSVRIRWEGKDIWSTGGNNIPSFLQTERGQSIQDKLNEVGKTPNLSVFKSARFPKMLQRPSEGSGPNQSDALMTSRFTLNGLVDSK